MIPRGLIKFRRDVIGFELREKIKKALTVYPESTSSFSTGNEVIRLWSEDGDYLGVPRGFFNDKLRGKYIDDYEFEPSMGSATLRPVRNPFPPREGQDPVMVEAIRVMQQNPFGGAIIEAKTAAGKTYMGTEISRRIGLKTLVIVPTTVLAEQWEKEIKLFCPEWKIGRLQADRFDIHDKDVVITILNSASMKDYPDEVYDEFGLAIADEVHLLGGPEFSQVLYKFRPRYFLGLTGTLQRSDKAEKVFIYGIGGIVKGMDSIEVLTPEIFFIDTQFSWKSSYGNDRELDRQKPYFLKSVISSEPRNEIIIRQAVRAAQSGRNILILSERVAHAEFLCMAIRKRGVQSIGVMVGTTKQKDRDISSKAQIICATNQLIGTGFNEPRLDTLIFATPIQKVEQPVGRILRTHPGKKNPFVLDLVDSRSHIGMVLGKSRRKKYSIKGWPLKGAEVFQR